MSTKPIKTVAIIGGSGNTGTAIQNALLAADFEVTVVTRHSSNPSVPDGVKVIKTDYSHQSLVDALKGQDAVVSTMATFFLDKQYPVVDAAIEAGVRRFLPSEYGVDTSTRGVGEQIPPALTKTETVAYLKTHEHKMSWTALIVGAFFDFCFDLPGALGCNLDANKATIFDGGNVAFEATNLDQIGRAVAAILSVDHLEATANQYVYINSFTITQNQMFKTIEDLSGKKFEVTHAKADEYNDAALAKMQSDPSHGQVWQQGVVQAISLIMINYRRFCEFSKAGKLWNERLGLPRENPENTIKAVLARRAAAAAQA